jgi:hypothetical protein
MLECIVQYNNICIGIPVANTFLVVSLGLPFLLLMFPTGSVCKFQKLLLNSNSLECLICTCRIREVVFVISLLISAHVEGLLRCDYFIYPHYRYYVREMRIMAYTQLLESYRSLTLQYMADAFGVTVEYIDQ